MTSEEIYDKPRPTLKAMQSQAKKELPSSPWDKPSLDRLMQDDAFGADQKEYQSRGRIRQLQEMLSADEEDEDQI